MSFLSNYKFSIQKWNNWCPGVCSPVEVHTGLEGLLWKVNYSVQNSIPSTLFHNYNLIIKHNCNGRVWYIIAVLDYLYVNRYCSVFPAPVPYLYVPLAESTCTLIALHHRFLVVGLVIWFYIWILLWKRIHIK